jgi:hypothetical protein
MVFAEGRQIHPVKMHLDIVVPFHQAPAHYSVLKEAEGIYLAVLQHYEGTPSQCPPDRIVLLKSFRNWTGSTDQAEFVNQLGWAIDQAAAAKPAGKSR